jgi:hypothetical protein
MLALLVLWPAQLRAQDGAASVSPVEEVKRAADEIQRIRTLIRELPEGKEDAALDLQLEKAEAAEKGILQRLRDAASEAKRQGKKEEADRLSKLFREAVRNTDYSRSMEADRPKPSPVEYARIRTVNRYTHSQWTGLTKAISLLCPRICHAIQGYTGE